MDTPSAPLVVRSRPAASEFTHDKRGNAHKFTYNLLLLFWDVTSFTLSIPFDACGVGCSHSFSNIRIFNYSSRILGFEYINTIFGPNYKCVVHTSENNRHRYCRTYLLWTIMTASGWLTTASKVQFGRSWTKWMEIHSHKLIKTYLFKKTSYNIRKLCSERTI